MYNLIIKNALVADGSGNEPKILDVAIQNDEVTNIAPKIDSSAQSVIDAKGKVLAPGFVDPQNHSDSYWQLFDNPSLDSLITQGFTTILTGNCGGSLAPLLSHEALLSVQKWHNLDAANINWQSYSEYLDVLEGKKFACNVAGLVGYSTLRRAIVGDQIRSLEKNEIAALKVALEESLKKGAFGLSSGLSYAHEIIISELELYELAKIIKAKNALFSIHLRSEGREIVEAVDEAIDIAKNTGVNLKISHLKIRNETNWGKFGETLEQIETAYHQGTNIHFDVYPYDTTWQALYSYLPKWSIEGGRTIMLKHFSDPTQKNKILLHLNNLDVKFSSMQIASTASKLSFAGKTIGQVAKNLGVSSEQAVLNIIENGGSEVLVFEKNLDQEQVNKLTLHPLSFLGTDGAGFSGVFSGKLVHPRCFGTAGKFLNYALVTKKLPLEKAIKKLTSGPAKKIGLRKRGEIKVGNYADLVIFDPTKINDTATYENPYQFTSGINFVFVNGQAAIAEGKITGQLAGRTLRKN